MLVSVSRQSRSLDAAQRNPGIEADPLSTA